MENNKNRRIADTMEINSILEEARKLRNSDASQKQEVPKANEQAATKKAETKKVDDDFVIYNDRDEKAPKNKKKSKKTALIVTIVAIVLLLGVAGFVFGPELYSRYFDDFRYADNIYVNDVAIGGLSEYEAEELLAKEEQRITNDINVVVTAQGKSYTVTATDLTYTFNTEEVLEEAYQYSEDNFITSGEQKYILKPVLSDGCSETVAQTVSKAIDTEASNAVVSKFDSSKKGIEKFTFEDEVKGVALDRASFTTQLEAFFDEGKVNGTIVADVEVVEPKYTKAYLQENMKKLSSFTTTSTNDANGNANMKLSMSACNNSIINPGETWSFNKCTGDSNQASRGYKPAGVIVNGKFSTGIGGGICQSSTTIYNAAMLSGMEIVERSCHYYPSTYVDAGRDATVDYGNIDLKVKNPFEYQLFMECYMKGTVLYCNIYGIPNEDFDRIAVKSKVTSRENGRIKAETTRTYYLNDEKVKTEKMPSSSYYSSGGGSSSSSSSTTKPTKKPETKPTESKPQETQPNDPTEAPQTPTTPVEPQPPVEPDPPVVDPPAEAPTT